MQKIDNDSLVAGDGFLQIGSTLKDARRSKGLSVKNVSEQLRISVDFLSKLEAGAFNELPAPAYVIGFLRSYGRYVGLDPDPLVARYKGITDREGAKPSYKTPMSTRPPQRSAPAVASMVVLFALAAYGGWFWLKTNSLPGPEIAEADTKTAVLSLSPDREDISIDLASLDQPAGVELAVDNLPGDVDVSAGISPSKRIMDPPGIGSNTIENQVNAKIPAEFITSDKAAPELAEFGTLEAQSGTIGQVKTDLMSDEAQTSNRLLSDELVKTQILTTRNSASADLLKSNGASADLRDPAKEITIRAVAASWVEIVRDNGEEVMAKLMQAGDSYVVEGSTRLFLSTGNAGGLTVVIGTNKPLLIGDIGEIVRDLPLVTDELRKSL